MPKVGLEPAQLSLGRQRAGAGLSQQPRTSGTRDKQLPRHPQVQQQARVVVQPGDQIFAAPLEREHATARKAAPQARGRGDEEVAGRGGLRLTDRASDQQRRDLTARDFDFGQFGHVRGMLQRS